jgi:hypothetical protein
MSFSSDLYSFLTSDGTLTGFVGTRIHPNRVPADETFPYLRVFTVSTEPQRTLAGHNTHRAPLVQFSIFSRSYDQAISIRERLMELFDGYRGNMGTGPTFVQHATFQGDREQWEDANPVGHHHFAADFRILYNV